MSGYVGNSALGTQDVDLYRLTLQAGDLVQFAGTCSTQGWGVGRLRLFDASGTDLTGRVGYYQNFYSPTGGTYYVGLSASGNTAYNPATAGTGSGGAASFPYTLTWWVQPLTLDDVGATTTSPPPARSLLFPAPRPQCAVTPATGRPRGTRTSML
ncbi:MAG: hypothetical protein U0840_30015 [Gemmataceae bacterium]